MWLKSIAQKGKLDSIKDAKTYTDSKRKQDIVDKLYHTLKRQVFRKENQPDNVQLNRKLNDYNFMLVGIKNTCGAI